jgi:hypothetical protein
MDRRFTDDDREKHIVTSDGQKVGRVRVVENDRATVEQASDEGSLTDEFKELLGWSGADGVHELRQDQVHRYDDELHLKPLR